MDQGFLYDSKESKVGKVFSVELTEKGNKVKSLVISKLTGNFVISSDYIDKIEKRVFLNVSKKELIKKTDN